MKLTKAICTLFALSTLLFIGCDDDSSSNPLSPENKETTEQEKAEKEKEKEKSEKEKNAIIGTWKHLYHSETYELEKIMTLADGGKMYFKHNILKMEVDGVILSGAVLAGHHATNGAINPSVEALTWRVEGNKLIVTKADGEIDTADYFFSEAKDSLYLPPYITDTEKIEPFHKVTGQDLSEKDVTKEKETQSYDPAFIGTWNPIRDEESGVEAFEMFTFQPTGEFISTNTITGDAQKGIWYTDKGKLTTIRDDIKEVTEYSIVNNLLTLAFTGFDHNGKEITLNLLFKKVTEEEKEKENHSYDPAVRGSWISTVNEEGFKVDITSTFQSKGILKLKYHFIEMTHNGKVLKGDELAAYLLSQDMKNPIVVEGKWHTEDNILYTTMTNGDKDSGQYTVANGVMTLYSTTKRKTILTRQ